MNLSSSKENGIINDLKNVIRLSVNNWNAQIKRDSLRSCFSPVVHKGMNDNNHSSSKCNFIFISNKNTLFFSFQESVGAFCCIFTVSQNSPV